MRPVCRFEDSSQLAVIQELFLIEARLAVTSDAADAMQPYRRRQRDAAKQRSRVPDVARPCGNSAQDLDRWHVSHLSRFINFTGDCAAVNGAQRLM